MPWTLKVDEQFLRASASEHPHFVEVSRYGERCLRCGMDVAPSNVIGFAALPCMAPCSLCGSLEHGACGFCSRCKEHTTFTIDPEDGSKMSECCSASGWAYDEGADL